MIAKDTDVEIEQQVCSELRWELGTGAQEIGINVKSGLVTLTGSVASYASRVAAREAAHRVLGVLDVADEIRVKIPSTTVRSDADIARAVRSALEWDVLVPDDRITSTVSDGLVTLEGTVETLTERNDAEVAVRRLAGVLGVHNRITVVPVKLEPAEVQEKIEEALERRAIREAERLNVSVEDGVVTLSGPVQSWDEKRAIMGAVSHAPGVKRVNDQLWFVFGQRDKTKAARR